MRLPPTLNLVFITLALLTSSRSVRAVPAPRALPLATEKQLRVLLKHPLLREAHVGVSIIALGTVADANAFPARPYSAKQQPVLFAVDADKRFMPASNVKLYTAALALRALGPQATFPTRVTMTGTLKDGVLDGDLLLTGAGDPSLATEDLRDLARQVAGRGIKRIMGGVSATSGIFEAETFGGRYPDGWTLDDTIWYYGPEISSLAINRNQIDITIEGGAQPGLPAKVTIAPVAASFPVTVQVMTGGAELTGKSETELLHFDRSGATGAVTEALTIRGLIAPGHKLSEGFAVPNPALWATMLFRQALQENGVAVGTGLSQRLDRNTPRPAAAHHESPPLRVLLRRLLKNSDNLYAEMLLRDAAAYSGGRSKIGTRGAAGRGHELLLNWLRESGVPTESLQFTDGSGLSRYNLVTPAATAKLLAVVEAIPGSTAIWEALPIAGVDGTLRNRMKGTAAAANARAKTGTFSIASTLSGYVTTRDGHRLAVSLLTNFARDSAAIRRFQDQFYAILAAATWSTMPPKTRSRSGADG